MNIKGVATYTASTSLPFPQRERATAGLRAQLKVKLLEAGESWVAELPTVEVTAPEVSADAQGREWFTYRAELHTQGGE